MAVANSRIDIIAREVDIINATWSPLIFDFNRSPISDPNDKLIAMIRKMPRSQLFDKKCKYPPTLDVIKIINRAVPLAIIGGNPKAITRIGALSHPPPIPSIPASTPTNNPIEITNGKLNE